MLKIDDNKFGRLELVKRKDNLITLEKKRFVLYR